MDGCRVLGARVEPTCTRTLPVMVDKNRGATLARVTGGQIGGNRGLSTSTF